MRTVTSFAGAFTALAILSILSAAPVFAQDCGKRNDVGKVVRVVHFGDKTMSTSRLPHPGEKPGTKDITEKVKQFTARDASGWFTELEDTDLYFGAKFFIAEKALLDANVSQESVLRITEYLRERIDSCLGKVRKTAQSGTEHKLSIAEVGHRCVKPIVEAYANLLNAK